MSLKSILPLALALIAAFARTGTAGVLNVPADFPTIQAAIDAAFDGDIVLVAPGTYPERIDFKGKAIRVTSSAGAAQTTIDGGQGGSVVTFANGEGLDSILERF